MKALLIVIFAFLVLIYLYTFIRYKKRKKNEVNTVDSYRRNYIERINTKSSESCDDYLRKQITKYNSSVDYIEWNDFVSEVNEQKHAADPKTVKPKRLQY